MHLFNCTCYSALGEDDERYLAARAIQLFARGVPQVYYVGLLQARTTTPPWSEPRRAAQFNRHDYTSGEIRSALDRPVVRRIVDLVRLRNTHSAFDGDLPVEAADSHSVRLRWQHGLDELSLDVDFDGGSAVVTDGGRVQSLSRWATSLGTNAV